MDNSSRDDAVVEAETWNGWLDIVFPFTACLGVGGNGGGEVFFSKLHLLQHQHPLFGWDLKLETVNLFLRKVEHRVCQGRAAREYDEVRNQHRFGMVIDGSWGVQLICHCIYQQGVTVSPSAYGSDELVTQMLFKWAFSHRFVSEITITAFQNVICALQFSRRDCKVAHLNKHFSELNHRLQAKLSNMHEDPMYHKNYSKLPAGHADWMIASTCVQLKLQEGFPFTLADSMVEVGQLAELTTLHPAVMGTPVNHRTDVIAHYAAPSPMSIRPNPMDLAIARVNSRCYCCNRFGHDAC